MDGSLSHGVCIILCCSHTHHAVIVTISTDTSHTHHAVIVTTCTDTGHAHTTVTACWTTPIWHQPDHTPYCGSFVTPTVMSGYELLILILLLVANAIYNLYASIFGCCPCSHLLVPPPPPHFPPPPPPPPPPPASQDVIRRMLWQ